MKLSNLEDVTVLRNYRRNAAKMRDAAMSGSIVVTLSHDLDPFSFIEAEPIRKVLHDELDRFVKEQERKLSELGVEVDDQP